MLANVLDFGAGLPIEHSNLVVTGNLICEKVESKNISGEELYELAAKCYSRCLKLKKNDDLVWFEMSANYYLRSVRYCHGPARKECLELAFESVKHLVQLCALAQHSFIKAVTLDKKTFTSWCNLCTQLGFHLESSIGYSNFVCSVLNEEDYSKDPKYEYAIDKMHAVPLALDSINWHCVADSDTTFEA
ncbi:unnamed protein product [Diamesa hyperborea]